MTGATDDTAPFVHRRPNPRAHHPLLVWHLGIWNPIKPEAIGPDKPEDQVAKAMEDREARAAAYTRELLDRIKTRLKDQGEVAERSFHSSHEKLTMAAPVSCAFNMPAFRAQIRVDLDLEYMTITVLLDLAPRSGRLELQQCDKRVLKVVNELNKFRDKIDDSLKHDAAHQSDAPLLSRKQLQPVANACFSDIWTFFGDEILETESDAFKALGKKRFADFRSLYLGDQVKKVELPANVDNRPGYFQRPFWRGREKNRRDHKDPIGEKNWRGRFHVLWPLMTAPVKKADIVDHEFTATIFEGSALHLTGMGARPTNATSKEAYPLYYGVYTVGMGGWAIGRLVSQLCELGTLRLAASQDMELLEEAAGPLREAEIAVQKAFDLNLPGPASKTRRDSVVSLQNTLEWVHKRKQFADGLVPGGIAHRAERSAYYIKRFQGVLKGLTIGSYDDFQPYKQFVHAHHGAAFSYIESLGTRYGRLIGDMRSLYQRMVAEEGRNRYYEIVRIQNFAEFLSVGILAPYYLGMIVSHMVGGEAHMPKGWWSTIFIALLAVATSRLRVEHPSNRKWRSVAFVALVMVAVAAFSMAVHFLKHSELETLSPVVAAPILTSLALAISTQINFEKWPRFWMILLSAAASSASTIYFIHSELRAHEPISMWWWAATAAVTVAVASMRLPFGSKLVRQIAVISTLIVGAAALVGATLQTWPNLIHPAPTQATHPQNAAAPHSERPSANVAEDKRRRLEAALERTLGPRP